MAEYPRFSDLYDEAYHRFSEAWAEAFQARDWQTVEALEREKPAAAYGHAITRPEWQPPPQRNELLWYAIDFDQTLADSAFDPETGRYEINQPLAANVGKLFEVRDAGYKIVIHTARGWEHYETVESWLRFHGIPFDRIVCGKLLAVRYVDDRAIPADAPSWLP